MSKNTLKKRKNREEKKKHLKGKNTLQTNFTNSEKKKGLLGIALIVIMAVAAAALGLYQLS